MTKMVLKTVPLGVLFTTTLTRRVGVRVKWPHDWAQDGALAEATGQPGDVAVYFDDGETQRVRGELVVEVEELYEDVVEEPELEERLTAKQLGWEPLGHREGCLLGESL